MNNLNDSKSFIALDKLKHEAYIMCCSQVELKLTDFTLLNIHTLPIHGTAWRVFVWSSYNITRDKNRMTVKVLFPLHIYRPQNIGLNNSNKEGIRTTENLLDSHFWSIFTGTIFDDNNKHALTIFLL